VGTGSGASGPVTALVSAGLRTDGYPGLTRVDRVRVQLVHDGVVEAQPRLGGIVAWRVAIRFSKVARPTAIIRRRHRGDSELETVSKPS